MFSFPEQILPKVMNSKHLITGETLIEKIQKFFHRDWFIWICAKKKFRIDLLFPGGDVV